MLTRRNFFKSAGLGAAVAASASFPRELLSWAEPPRAPQPGGPLLLNSNENAYGPFPSVLAMEHPFEGFNRYPDHHSDIVSEQLAARHKVDVENLVTGCGSTEVLRIAAMAFTGPGRKLVMASPTFEAVGRYGEVTHAEVIRVPLAGNFAHDLGAMLKAAGSDAGLVYICNPNNPTANLTPRADLEDFARKLPRKTRLLIDEAYHDFVPAGPEYASFIDHPVGDDRIIVARTFSKIYGLAGMRLGYGVSAKSTIQAMRPYRTEDCLNICVTRCAMVSMADRASYQKAVERNAADRAEFMRQAATRKIPTIPSATNFVMMNANKPVRWMIDYFKSSNVLIGRPFPPMDTYIRVSLATPPEMQQFWQAWDRMPKTA
jgi:histidinol-phosphate aminotransferase